MLVGFVQMLAHGPVPAALTVTTMSSLADSALSLAVSRSM